METFRHRGLKRLFERGDASKIRADQVNRIEDVLAHLDTALHPSDLDLPGYRLHPLKGEMKGMWSITISGNWRIIFRFEEGNVYRCGSRGLSLTGNRTHADEKSATPRPLH